MFGSSVEPDLLDTMNSVRFRSIFFSVSATCAGSVESSTCKFWKTRAPAKGQSEHFGTQAGSAHAQQERILEPCPFNLRGELFEARQLCELFPGDA